MGEYQVVGKSVPRIDAREKVTGKAVFASDFQLPGMLFGKVLRSPYPHAKILSIDTGAAERLPGVKTVVTAKDTLQVKYGPMILDEQVLAVDKVRYIGDEIAAVAAVDETTAEEALQLIKVEYEILPAVFDAEEAMQEGAPLVHEKERNLAVHFTVNQGDVEEGFRQSDYIFEDRYQTPLVHQCYLEPITVVAYFDRTDHLTIWAASQEVFIARHEISQVLGMPESKVRIIQPYGGGGFGGKCDQKLLVVAAVLAQKAMVPVRLANTRAEEFCATRPRLPMVFYIKTGVKKDGTIMAKEVRIIADNGAYSSQGPPALSVAAIRSDSLYRFKNVRTEANLVYTNKVPTGAFRGFGNPQMHFALESHLDDIAYRIGMDPIQLRLKNATQTGDVTVHGWRMDSCGLSECLEKAAAASGWQEKRGKKEGSHPGKVRGIGAACMIHVSGNRSVCNEYDGSSAFVQIHLDGRVTVLCGDPDIGQGATTIFAQIAAEILGIPLDHIDVIYGDTDRTPYGIGAFASRVTTLAGNAVKMAAEDARAQLAKYAGQLLNAPAENVRFQSGKVMAGGNEMSFVALAKAVSLLRCGAEVTGVGMYDVGFPLPDRQTKYGNCSVGYPFGAQVAEVEVDTATGEVKLLNFVAAQDVGKAINPMSVEGQIEGGIAQGIGYALMEEQVVVDGKIVNPDWRDYKVPTPVDLPPIKVIIVESHEPKGPFGAKGAGEPPLVPTAPAIANAIFNATGIRIKELPITSEKILSAIKAKHNLA